MGLVGVQSNQFPRAVDLARPFLRAGLPVCIGGFHISGSIAMLPEMPAEMREAAALGISFFAGEAEHRRLDRVIRDAWEGSLQPLYNYMSDLPSLEGEPAPILPRKHARRVSGQLSSLDLGRGCPYQCTYCFNHAYYQIYKREKRGHQRDVDHLCDEINWVAQNYRLEQVIFLDDLFIIFQDWLEEFAEVYPKRVGIPFFCNVRANLMTPEKTAYARPRFSRMF